MGRLLTVAVCQPESRLGDLDGNIARHAVAVESTAADVVIFPELSLTGYDLDAPVVDPHDPALELLVDACAKTSSVALVGAPIGAPDGPNHIAVLRVDETGVAVVYRKIHVGSDEAARFSGGSEPAVVTVDGWRIGLAVCRDTGIESHAAATAELGIDVFAAGVVDLPGDAPTQLDRARRTALRHDVWVCVASAAGPASSGFPETAGRSFVMAPNGDLVARAGGASGEALTASLTA